MTSGGASRTPPDTLTGHIGSALLVFRLFMIEHGHYWLLNLVSFQQSVEKVM